MTEQAVLFLLTSLLLTAFSRELTDCLGFTEQNECCSKNRRELFKTDKLTIRMGDGYSSYKPSSRWCDKVVMVRRVEQSPDDCKGCTLTLRFSNSKLTNSPFPLEIYQANYTSISFYVQQTLHLTLLASFKSLTSLPTEITSTGNIIRIFIDQNAAGGSPLQMADYRDFLITITPNIPEEQDDLVLFLAVSIPTIVIFVFIFSVAVYKLRQRRLRRLSAHHGVGATSTALVRREMQRQCSQGEGNPNSPDPRDSIAPPSYFDVAPLPSYNDIVPPPETGGTSPTHSINVTDSDKDRLVPN